jgi:hypothetical protein
VKSSRIRQLEACFFREAGGNIVARSGVWISGKKICGKTDGFGEPSWPNEASAMIRR